MEEFGEVPDPVYKGRCGLNGVHGAVHHCKSERGDRDLQWKETPPLPKTRSDKMKGEETERSGQGSWPPSSPKTGGSPKKKVCSVKRNNKLIDDKKN